MCCYSSSQTCSSLWSPCVWLVHVIQISVQMSAPREALPHHLPEKPVHHTLHLSSSEPLSQFQAVYNCFGSVTIHTTYREVGMATSPPHTSPVLATVHGTAEVPEVPLLCPQDQQSPTLIASLWADRHPKQQHGCGATVSLAFFPKHPLNAAVVHTQGAAIFPIPEVRLPPRTPSGIPQMDHQEVDRVP